MSLVFLYGGGSSKIESHWDRVNKVVVNTPRDTPFYAGLAQDYLVDAYNVGNTLKRVYHNGTGGVNIVDTPNAVLYAINPGSGVLYWDQTTKTGNRSQPTIAEDKDGQPLFYNPNELLLDNYCIGTTKRLVIANGSSVRYDETINSPDCGFVTVSANVQITEKVLFVIDSECKENPVCVEWRNTLGGYNKWVFSKNQQVTVKTEDRGNWLMNFEDMELITNNSVSRGKDAQESIIVGTDNFPASDVKAFQELQYSIDVAIIEGGNRIPVKLPPGSFKYNTADSLITAEFELILPDIITITR